jgi:hypothetical protein
MQSVKNGYATAYIMHVARLRVKQQELKYKRNVIVCRPSIKYAGRNHQARILPNTDSSRDSHTRWKILNPKN